MPPNTDHLPTITKAALLGLALLLMAGYALFFTPVFTAPEPEAKPQEPARQTPAPQAAGPEPAPLPVRPFSFDREQEQRELLARFSADPALMSNSSIVDKNLTGLVISGDMVIEKAIFHRGSLQKMNVSGLTFRDCRFYNCDLSGSEFTGVVFEDCSFENSKLEYGKISDTLFVDCRFSSNGPEKSPKSARIAYTSFKNVTFRELFHDEFEMLNVFGDITFKKTNMGFMKFSADGGHEFFKNSGEQPALRLNLEDCLGRELVMKVRGMDSSLNILRGEYRWGEFSGFRRIQASHASFTNELTLSARDWLVVKNSLLCADLEAEQGIYLIDNSYTYEHRATAAPASGRAAARAVLWMAARAGRTTARAA